MKWKISTGILLLITLAVIGYSWKQNQPLEKNQDTPSAEQELAYRVYQNDEYGYRFHYPSYFDVDGQNGSEVFFRNNTCYPNEGLCIPGIDTMIIQVSEEPYYKTMDELVALGSGREIISINPLPARFDPEQFLKAVRHEFPGVPKQVKGGYTYELFHDGKLFTISFSQGDSSVSAYKDDQFVSLTKDDYDPLGDEIMRTFEFVETN